MTAVATVQFSDPGLRARCDTSPLGLSNLLLSHRSFLSRHAVLIFDFFYCASFERRSRLDYAARIKRHRAILRLVIPRETSGRESWSAKRGEGQRGRGCGPRETESMVPASSCMRGYCRVFAQFPPPSNDPRPFFFFLLFSPFFSPPKNREIPFNSLLENEPSSPPLLYWVLLRQERARARARATCSIFPG